MAEVSVARERGVGSLNPRNAVRRTYTESELNARVGSLVVGVINRMDLTSQQKNRYLRMIQRAGQRTQYT